MKLAWISNYINHHQIPLCEEFYAALGDGFHFVETRPMEQMRSEMGWGSAAGQADPAWLVRHYEDPGRADTLVKEADIALIGWAQREDLVAARMREGRPTIRLSERIYREGQWKRFSPRGLVHKYNEHIRYRRGPLWLLAIGAYTASDFRLIGAYPGKIFRWGYFPPFSDRDAEILERAPWGAGSRTELVWAGRFLPLKHPELALHGVKHLASTGVDCHLTMIGDGELREDIEKYLMDNNLTDRVTLTGYLSPEETRERMRHAQILLFNSDHLEGWGAVVIEAMSEGLAVIAGNEAGGPAVLIRDGINGLLYPGTDEAAFVSCLTRLARDPAEADRMGRAAYAEIRDLWNARHAAGELLGFCGHILNGTPYTLPEEGPMSADPARRPYVRTGG